MCMGTVQYMVHQVHNLEEGSHLYLPWSQFQGNRQKAKKKTNVYKNVYMHGSYFVKYVCLSSVGIY